jgi:hypothetical protein
MRNEFKITKFTFIIITLFFLFLAASCGGKGGGGSDDGASGESGGQPLSEYNFNLSLLNDYPLTLHATMDSEPVSVTLEAIFGGATFYGLYNLDDETITLSTAAVKATATMWSTPLTIQVSAPIISRDGNNPEQGSIIISNGEGFISVTITDEPSPGISLSLNDGTPVFYTWDEFDELLGSDKPDWQKQASFASSIIDFIFSQLRFVINGINLIEKNDTALSKGDVTITGDTFSGTPPAGHSAQGKLMLSNTDGDVGPGGDFSEVFNDYWVNDPSDDIDQLYSGKVSLVGFLEDSDDARDVITAIGFIPNSAEDPGGVFFDEGLTLYETQESPSGIFTIDDSATLTISGRYTIMFYEPEP